MRIVFLVPYPPRSAPSQRFRFENYLPGLVKGGHRVTELSFYTRNAYSILYRPGRGLLKALWVAWCFARRAAQLPQLIAADIVFVHREASPVGPPIFEWITARLFRKKVIFDFDDAIWLTDKTSEAGFERWVRNRGKISRVIAWSWRVSCGNAYLKDYALRFNPHCILIPSVVDLQPADSPSAATKSGLVTLGWTGSHSTLPYLKIIETVLQRLENEFSIRILVIADQPPSLTLRSLEFRPWREQSEIEDLRQIDIGLMPLPDNEWTRGKCGFKLIQYLAMGIPACASPVGVNSEIVEDGISGYLCRSDEEWYDRLKGLIQDPKLRNAQGAKGRTFIEAKYSVASQADAFMGLFT